jgi:hypothetical protein
MAFKINKGGPPGRFSYTKSGVVYGPMELLELLEYIEADTSVFVEGAATWVNAKEIPELKKHFPEIFVALKETSSSPSPTTIPEPEKKSSGTSSATAFFVIIFLLAIGSAGYYYVKHQEAIKDAEAAHALEIAEDSISQANLAAQLEYQRIQDSLLQANAAVMDSARILKLSADFAANQSQVKQLINEFLSDFSAKKLNVINYFSDTVSVFLDTSFVPASELMAVLNNRYNTNPPTREEFVIDDMTFHFEVLDGFDGVYSFSMSYAQISLSDEQVLRNGLVQAIVKLTPDYKIKYYQWVSFQPY